jgi:hypothetical protein
VTLRMRIVAAKKDTPKAFDQVNERASVHNEVHESRNTDCGVWSLAHFNRKRACWGNVTMGKLSEHIAREYNEEREIIRNAGGSLWLNALGTAFAVVVFFGTGALLGDPVTRQKVALGAAVVIFTPFIRKAWERHRVVAEMRHEREIRIDMKLNALLGLVNTRDDPEE